MKNAPQISIEKQMNNILDMKNRERGDIELFTTIVPQGLIMLIRRLKLTTLGLLLIFDWLVHLVEFQTF